MPKKTPGGKRVKDVEKQREDSLRNTHGAWETPAKTAAKARYTFRRAMERHRR